MSVDRTYLSVADTAKLVRKALKADFPGVKFSVRSSSYSGGASIDVRWTDGPTEKSVRGKTLWLYTGGSFDGMTDSMSYHDSMVMTDDGPQVVHFGADFVHGSREISPMRRSIYRVEIERFIGRKLPRKGTSYHETRLPVSCHDSFDDEPAGQLSRDEHQGDWLSTLVNRMAHLRPWKGERCPGSPDSYCAGCGRWQAGHELEPHNR